MNYISLRNNWKKKALTVTLAVSLIGTGSWLAAAPASAAANSTATVSSASSAVKAKRVVALAKSLKGKVQYQWGVNNRTKFIFDCSSFTKYVYEKQGVKLKWGARLQYNQFPHVSKANLKVGDLVFFSVGSSKTIGHVGIYIGNGKFIHNLSPKADVTISDLTKGYWKNHYKGGARVFK
ncbi:hypothetical protein J31TS4_13160 [Paenibacillus sp. J31TS4]|uniref:C40 family peptidase n=1 Tax=Paenibacillus sp. J31TS4 TaxID=2807195 RepID=UPI001B052C2C|nr:C40 family peptidase [Paenibacillus sp. J31TS4]GIP38036.1 hypothetical protein J31TS4_13160 [Paenibacillus sp. J31TS4]